MKLAHLRKIPERVSDAVGIRGTEAQDTPLAAAASAWARGHLWIAGGAAGLLLLLFAWLIHAWLSTGQVISRERLRLAEVNRGHFVRDVAADGTVVAAVSPTLFAIAPGTVSYLAHAGDAVHKDQVLATLDSAELTNEFQREQATLDSLDAALSPSRRCWRMRRRPWPRRSAAAAIRSLPWTWAGSPRCITCRSAASC